MTTHYTVTHRTEYGYDDVVTASYGMAVLLPRQVPGRQRVDAQVLIEPAPADQREHLDVYGNRALYFSVLAEHTQLVVTATSKVDVEPAPLMLDGPAWEDVRAALRSSTEPEVVDAVEFVLDSPAVVGSPAVAEYAAASFPPGRPIVAGAVDLMHRIHAEFDYVPGTTSLTTRIDEVLRLRSGVCQDFAQLFVGCMRSLGLAARYVSGYLETQPPPGQARLQGADASHAWAGVLVAGHGWIDLDPTNDLVVDDRFVVTGWGRDYHDVAPLKGVIFTESTNSTLDVAVDVIRR
jgi:transglutaminase-like putative cysteine protease